MDDLALYSANDSSWYQNLLTADEHVLWRGKPEKYSLIGSSDAFLIPFSVLWCGFAIFWELSVWRENAPLLFKLWGIPFVCVGLYMVFGRFYFKSRSLKDTDYVITNKKVIRRVGKKIDSLNGASLPPMETEFKEDGSGTIYFARNNYGTANLFYNTGAMNAFAPRANASSFSLTGLADVRQALAAIEEMQRGF